LVDVDTHSPWLATAAFYKALHIVEAVFSNDRAIRHTNDQDEREKALKSNRRYEQVYKHYAQLKRASLNARYLPRRESFDSYLRPQQVVDLLLRHHLHQLEESAAKMLRDPSKLDRVVNAFSNP
jgi:hypothetical protein